MKRRILTLLLPLLLVELSAQQVDQNYLLYIETFSEIAQYQQNTHGIPASIILAQGLLESSAGRSRLAIEANNHFGIKCHDWRGRTIYHDDDKKQECFRKYRRVSDSFEDHSLFLSQRPRYKSLFNLKPDDYVSWARGLKAAGYATDPHYAEKLIDIIEKYNLHRFDTKKRRWFGLTDDADQVSQYNREIYKSNYLKFVVATSYDTYASLSVELGISEKKLRRYNEVGEAAILQRHDIVYLKKKKRRASRAYPVHLVQPGESMYGISQQYGIQLNRLYKMNNMSYTAGAKIGQILKLR